MTRLTYVYGLRPIMFLPHSLIVIVTCELVSASSCGAGLWIEDETSGHCYQIEDSGVTWPHASRICKGVGSNLAIIESSEEQTFIADQMQKINFTAFGLWIGSEKVHPEEKSTWVNGEKFSYVNWAEGEPNNPPVDENCAVIDTYDGTWRDYKCTFPHGYICENTLNLSRYAAMSYIKDNNTDHYYKFSSSLLTWTIASIMCREDGGMLLVIETAEEQKFIQGLVSKMKSRLWIGSDRLHPEHKRTWANGKQFTYVNWAKGEPGNTAYIENCAEIYTSNKMWNDYHCSSLRGYICEKTPPEKPNTSQPQVFVIGVAVGSTLVLLAGILLLYCIIQKRKKRKEKRDEAYEEGHNIRMTNIENVYNQIVKPDDSYCTSDDLSGRK